MEPTEKPSYLPDALRIGAIFGVINVAISFVAMYQFISTPPTGSLFSMASLVPMFACLVSAFGGLIVVRGYAKSTGLTMKAGDGAKIGFITGAVITGFVVVIGQIWTQLIDPTMMERYTQATIANFEAIPNMPEDSLNTMIDATYKQFEDQKTFFGIVYYSLISLGVIGVLNLITGIIGVSVFAKKEEIL